LGGEIVVIQRDRLAEIPHQAISKLVKEYMEYPGEGYCEFEDEIPVCIASIPQGYSEEVLGLTLARAISIVDPREGKVYLYVEDSSLRSIENIVRKSSAFIVTNSHSASSLLFSSPCLS
jgi:hypothetical protein